MGDVRAAELLRREGFRQVQVGLLLGRLLTLQPLHGSTPKPEGKQGFVGEAVEQQGIAELGDLRDCILFTPVAGRRYQVRSNGNVQVPLHALNDSTNPIQETGRHKGHSDKFRPG
jgi:hypothetical protein